MGCFISTKRASTSPRKDDTEVAQPPKPPSQRSIAPSHHAEELETVKEVLSSETPKWNPITTSATTKSQPHLNKPLHKFKEEEEEEEEESKDDEKKALLMMVTQEEEASEVSEEVCSLISDNMSIPTTATEQREESHQETCKRVNGSPTKPHKSRSFSGDHGTKRDKKLHATGNGVGSHQRRGDQVSQPQRRVNGGTRNQPRRRNPGETSFRRSGDGAGRSVVGRCASARRTNGSPRTSVPENGCRKMEVPVREGKWADDNSNETLESPLVSLECFIFI